LSSNNKNLIHNQISNSYLETVNKNKNKNKNESNLLQNSYAPGPFASQASQLGEDFTLLHASPLVILQDRQNSIYNLSLIHFCIIKIYTFLNGKYLLDVLYNNYLISGSLKTGHTISKLLDKGIIELIGPFGLTEGTYKASSDLSKLDTGIITTYALYITLGLISILFIIFSFQSI